MLGTGGFEKNINVVVGGNAAGYMAAMTSATAVTKAFKIGVAAAGAAIVVFSGIMLKKAVSAAADFEEAMAGVKAVTQATPKEFDKLIKKAKELGRVTKFTMLDIAAGEEALGRAGFTTNEILSSMSGIADMAAASGISLGQAADIASKTIRAMGLEASDSTRIADVFAQAAANSNVTITMLGESMKYVAPLARAMGLSLEQTVGAIGKLGDVGIQGTMAGTALRFTFSELLAETDGFKEKIDELNLSMEDLTGPNGELLSFTEILSKLSEAGADTGDIIDLVGKRAGPAIGALVQNNPALKEFVEQLENAEGAAKKMADIRLDTLRGQLEVLQGSWQLMLVTIGEKVTPILQAFVQDTVIPAVNEFAAWAEESDALGNALETFFGKIVDGFTWLIDNYQKVVTGLKAILAAVALLVAAKIIAGLKVLALAISGLWVALGPIGVAILAASYGIKKLHDVLTPMSEAAREATAQVRDMEASFEALAESENRAAEVSEILQMAINMAGGELVKLIDTGGLTVITLGEIMDEMALLQTEIVESGASASTMADMWESGVNRILGAFIGLIPGIASVLNQIVAQSQTAAAAVAGAWDPTIGLGGGNVFGNLLGGIPQAGPTIAGAPAAFTAAATPSVVAATEAIDDLAESATDAAQAAKDAAAEALKLQQDAASAMRVAFESKFTEPIAAALATGNWEEAAQAVKAMAVSFPELTAEAAEVSAALEAVEMGSISQIDVLRALTGMENELLSVLEERIALAELAGDLDMATSLGKILESLFSAPEVERTWQEKTSEWLDKGFSGMIDMALSMLPGKFGALAKGLFDTFKTALTDPLGAITSALGVAQIAIQMIFDALVSRLQDRLDDLKEQRTALKEQEAALTDAMSFYVSTLQKVGSLLDNIFGKFGVIGQVASATMNAFISSIEMLTLEGFDLLRAGVQMLTSFISSLIGAITGLIEKSDAYQAVQSEGQRAWKAISDLFGQFLWPLAALLQHILDWLGIQTQANEQAARAVEIGVPSMWKRAERAYEAAAPGQIFTGTTGGGGVQIPTWAKEIVEGIAEAIEGLLKKFGIDSWADLLEKFKAGSIRFWNYVETNIPKLISALSSIFSTLSDAFGGGIVDTIVDWLRRGFDWLVNEAPGVVAKAVDFMGDLFELAGFVWNWLKGIDWDELLGMIRTKFDEFMTALDGIKDIPEIVSEITAVAIAIGKVETAIGDVEREIERLKDTFRYVMAIVGGGIVGAIIGGSGILGGPIKALAGALIGAGLGGLFAGLFDKGGIVPGPVGSPRLAMVHGGEAVLTPAQQRGSGATIIENHVHLEIAGEDVTDWIVEKVQQRGKHQIGRYATSAGITRKY